MDDSYDTAFAVLLDLSDGEVRRICGGISPDGLEYKFVYNDNCQYLNVYTNPSAGMIGCPSLFDNKTGYPMCVCISVDDRGSGVFSLVGSPKICNGFHLVGCDRDGVHAGPVIMDDLSGSPKECD